MEMNTEKTPIFGPVQYIKGVISNVAAKNAEQKKAQAAENNVLPKVQTPAVISNLPKMLETLPEIEKLEQFKFLLDCKRRDNDEFIKHLENVLPKLSDEMLVYVMDFTKTEVEKLWHLRARCVAEAYSRCPSLPGGRSKNAGNEGREELAKQLAKRFNTSVTNIRIDERIIRVFGTYVETKKTPTDSAGVYTKPKVTRDSVNDYITEIVFETPKFVGVSTFQPDPDLTRQHYVVASRLSPPEAKQAIEDTLTSISANIPCSAEDLKRRLFPRKVNRPGYLKIEPARYPNTAVKVEFTLSEDDAKVFYEMLSTELSLESSSMKSAKIDREIKANGFECLMNIFRERLN